MVGYLGLEYREPTPPENRPLGKMELFYKQSFRMQCFIYLKYKRGRTRKLIKKYLFMTADSTYYIYNRKAKKIVSDAFG